MYLREALFQPAQHLAKPIQRKLRMQAAHNVKFRHRFGPADSRRLPDLFERHGVRIRIFRTFAKGAKPTTGHADIGRIDVPVDVEIGTVAMKPFTHQVGHVADSKQV